MRFGKVIVTIANEHAWQIWAMLAHEVDDDPHACLNHLTGWPGAMHQRTKAVQQPRNRVLIQRQRDTVDNRSDQPGANLTNEMDVQTVQWLIPGYRTVR